MEKHALSSKNVIENIYLHLRNNSKIQVIIKKNITFINEKMV